MYKTIKEVWEYDNINCWLIKRKGMVSVYLYIPTLRFVYRSSVPEGGWYGLSPSISGEIDIWSKNRVEFKTEQEAVLWFIGRTN